jgi:hypothetical protein
LDTESTVTPFPSPKRSSSWPDNLSRAFKSNLESTDPQTPKKKTKSIRFTFWNYIKSEITGSYHLDEGFENSMAKREEVYNFIQVPLHLEKVCGVHCLLRIKLLLFGLLLCTDSFLFLFTFLPIRIFISLVTLFFRLFTSR